MVKSDKVVNVHARIKDEVVLVCHQRLGWNWIWSRKPKSTSLQYYIRSRHRLPGTNQWNNWFYVDPDTCMTFSKYKDMKAAGRVSKSEQKKLSHIYSEWWKK